MRIHRVAKTFLVATTVAVSGCVIPAPPAVQFPTTSGFTFSELPPLPDSIGFAGAYSGVSDGNLIVAGGTNFPNSPPWKGGTKAWYDTAFVLPKGESSWRKIDHALPSPRGYGGSISTRHGLLCIGGADAKQHYSDVFFLRWTGATIEKQDLPPLPLALAYVGAAESHSTIYVIGGSESPTATAASNRCFTLDLANAKPQWRELEPLPGPGRILPAIAGQPSFFVVSGASLHTDVAGKPARTYLTDAFRYVDGEGWKRIADVPHATVAAPAIEDCFEDGILAVLGGDDGANVNFEPKEQHPGFSRDILLYNHRDDSWRMFGKIPLGQVTTNASWLDGRCIIPGGEIRPAVRTPVVTVLTPTLNTRPAR